MKALSLLALVLLLAACAAAPSRQHDPIDTRAALSGTAILGEPVDIAQLPEHDLLTLAPEIREYLATIAPGASPRQRLLALIQAFESREFRVEYDADSTLSATETYRQQRGNCLAFTLMMVAMARELGAEAYFNQVDVPPVWSHDEAQTFVVYRHINMVSESARGRRVVDFNLDAYDPLYDQRKLSDTDAFAQFYSNRGIELMKRNEREEAFRYLRKALQLRPEDSSLWSNLGALYSRYGYYDEAEQSYRKALALRPNNLVAISNLERLYRHNGRKELADYYAQRARYHREHNPYYLFYQARNAYEHGEYRRAKQQLRRALWQYEDDHRFHFLMGLTNYRLGALEASKESFREAFSLANNPATVNAYARKLDYLRRVQQ
ncbi:tetratricopeptide repeat protein [Microbulbifer thermotolerans]|uniref:tetratricopeptide repeat protein n=1 Tax=Microbulbifer thermotolerans TaxID=252514 RepID=UPI0008F32E25|nr:tetratricopeptide repeat protein [Microbulbifer thermotolerans]MCX2780905.1 tetratricopeptide repeat protein [Microbulbifer thermotolerans]MCX2783544.1 tetratricopeptide repeat protein [Microbulbifer thermotolerans]MCX2806639.1 tetratricopeptide repeat protein [Microbulbifer thermotolerans]MCX2831525.1 tetratricopeptide repeat protein [Microbulbifer thermotolerans]MCX2842928.1 tetratricopeptide repeat protein [Microbulbifer thermotolerans]